MWIATITINFQLRASDYENDGKISLWITFLFHCPLQVQILTHEFSARLCVFFPNRDENISTLLLFYIFIHFSFFCQNAINIFPSHEHKHTSTYNENKSERARAIYLTIIYARLVRDMPYKNTHTHTVVTIFLCVSIYIYFINSDSCHRQ